MVQCVHNLLHSRQAFTELLPQVTCTENFVNFGHVIFETCERTDRQTDRETHVSQYIAPLPAAK